jgi:nicotinamidase/pyrazinamidase
MKASQKALIVVDLQNDFMPGGALPTRNGNEVVAVANKLMPFFGVVVASQDWHPPNHGSFASQYASKKPGEHVKLAGIDQILWPEHCVQDTEGAKFAADLNAYDIEKVIHKGIDPAIDSYSTFFDNAHKRETGLHQYLKDFDVKDVYLLGLATDYCVKYSVLDALHLGYRTFVVTDGCRGVNLSPDDSERALSEMAKAGAHLATSEEVAAALS